MRTMKRLGIAGAFVLGVLGGSGHASAGSARMEPFSVGVWPNYYFNGHPQPVFDSPKAKAAARSAHLGHSMLWIDWHEQWYVDGCVPAGPCALRDSDNDGKSDLSEYLKQYLDAWAGRASLGLDVNLVIQVHTHGFGVNAAGPAWLHLSPEGILPTNDPRVIGAFRTFYEELYNVMNDGSYRCASNRAEWLVAIGNEVDVYLPDGQSWLRYIDFLGQLYANQVNGNPRHVPVSFTTSTTYVGGVIVFRDFARELFRVTDAISLTHYPIWFEAGSPERNNHPVHHSVVAQDFGIISTFVDEVTALREAPIKAFLQEVGYPTGTGCPVFPPGHPQAGQLMTPCDPLVEQQHYVEDVFAMSEQYKDKMGGLTWWSLQDYSVDECNAVWGGLSSPWCTMGLLDANQKAKPSFQTFRVESLDVKNW